MMLKSLRDKLRYRLLLSLNMRKIKTKAGGGANFFLLFLQFISYIYVSFYQRTVHQLISAIYEKVKKYENDNEGKMRFLGAIKVLPFMRAYHEL